MLTIRPARVEDARAGAECHLACWREAYADIADPVALAARTGDLEHRTTRWETAIAAGEQRWVVVDASGEVVGFAAAGDGRDGEIDPDLEVYAINVRAFGYGTGVGAALLATAAEIRLRR